LLAIWFCGPQAWPKSHHPAFMAPEFEFRQIDTLCVMPLIDARKDMMLHTPFGLFTAPALHFESLRNLAIDAIKLRGYQVNSDCDSAIQGGSPHSGNSHWLLTVRVDFLWVTGAVLTGSLFDTQTGKEVWNDNTNGRRSFKNALRAEYGGVDPRRTGQQFVPRSLRNLSEQEH
jgi:hypothetical protein